MSWKRQSQRKSKRDGVREDYWKKILARRRQSSLSTRAFCQEEGITEGAFYTWRRELNLRDQDALDNGKAPPKNLDSHSIANPFVPLQLVSAVGNPECGIKEHRQVPEDDTGLEITSKSGLTIMVREKTNLEILAKVLRLLEDITC